MGVGLLHDVYKLPAERMYATVFEGSEEDGVPFDEEAYGFWKRFLPEDHIIRGNKHDNFWEMGETGPCGPCSEIHFDLRDEAEIAARPGREMVNAGHPQVIEIWNLVFMQFNRKANGSLEEPAGAQRRYGHGLRAPLHDSAGQEVQLRHGRFPAHHRPHRGPFGQALRSGREVRRGHARHGRTTCAPSPSRSPTGSCPRTSRRATSSAASCAAPCATATPTSASRSPRCAGSSRGWWSRWAGSSPSLKAQQTLIEKVIEEEESSFLRTLATGINLLDGVIERTKREGRGLISGRDAFELYDTFGFPIDLTELIAREQGVGVDLAAFEGGVAGPEGAFAQRRGRLDRRLGGACCPSARVSLRATIR